MGVRVREWMMMMMMTEGGEITGGVDGMDYTLLIPLFVS